jgi:xanthine dehydrogenase/oxidase
MLSDKLDTQRLEFHGDRVTWHRPLNMTELLDLKSRYPHAKLVVGNTEVGLEVKFKNCLYPVLIQPTLVRELSEVHSVPGEGVVFGAAVTLTEVETYLRREVEEQPRHSTKVFVAILEMLRWFAGKQIRNVGSLGGNIMTGSPISDLNPVFMAANCELQVQNKRDGIRVVRMDHNFFTSYRKNVLKPDEVLLSIKIPYTRENQHFIAYKQAKRREDDITIVNAVFNISLNHENGIVENAALAFGGMAPTTVMALRTAEVLKGRVWNEETLQLVLDSLVNEMTLDPGAPGGMVRYRRSLTLGFFFKFFLSVQQERGNTVESRDASAMDPYQRLVVKH